MSKTKHIDFRMNEQLQSIDDELDAAMDRLEMTTARVGDVLTTYFNEGKLAISERPPAAELDDDVDDAAAPVSDEATDTDE